MRDLAALAAIVWAAFLAAARCLCAPHVKRVACPDVPSAVDLQKGIHEFWYEIEGRGYCISLRKNQKIEIRNLFEN